MVGSSQARSLGLVAVVLALAAGAGCAKKPNAPVASAETTAARVRSNVRLSDDLARACHVQFGNAERAPKFDYDDDTLLPEDRDVLEQIARCITQGPLKGRELLLIGRADPRGETEYNMVLGQERAVAVKDYLARLGVDGQRLDDTTRGELDAQGHDEDTWRSDRRVDLSLK